MPMGGPWRRPRMKFATCACELRIRRSYASRSGDVMTRVNRPASAEFWSRRSRPLGKIAQHYAVVTTQLRKSSRTARQHPLGK